jgi:adenylosuccinate lyase
MNETRVREVLKAHPEIIAEAIQTILRREGVAMPYEELKKMTRGKQVTMEDFAKFIDSLSVSDSVKQELKAITPENYVGLAEKLAKL